MTRFVAFVSTVALAAVAMAAPAAARDFDAPVSREVAYSDLNLDSPAGAETLNRRIRAAAKAVCGVTPGLRDIAQRKREQRCVEEAVSATAAKVSRAVASAVAGAPVG